MRLAFSEWWHETFEICDWWITEDNCNSWGENRSPNLIDFTSKYAMKSGNWIESIVARKEQSGGFIQFIAKNMV